MTTEEDRELMAKISSLAGQINRHKYGSQDAQPSGSNHHQTSQYRYNPYQHARGSSHLPRGSSRGAFRAGRRLTQHRHRTLVLNGSGAQTPTSTGSDGGGISDASTTWVSRNDRHLQLINSSVYEKDAKARVMAIEQSRQQKLRRQDELEKARLQAFFAGGAGAAYPSSSTNGTGSYEVEIEGIRFRVAKGGSKLVKLPGDGNAPEATPKMTTVGGVRFFRTKHGNLVRDGIVKAHRHFSVKKVKEPCTFFSTTGSCQKGPLCRYIHDPAKVAICKSFLKKGECDNGERCDLSHDLTPERTPGCLHYAKGNCANPQCTYTHQDIPSSAPVCRAFGLYGFCEKGASCTERHAFECPDFANTGKCTIRGCKLVHRERASVLRKTGQDAQEDFVMDDLSSDGGSVASDDIDSDAVEEIFGDDSAEDFDLAEQKEFISFE